MPKSDPYKEWFKERGLLNKVDAWLKENPKPYDWQGTKYSYAHTEMPILKLRK